MNQSYLRNFTFLNAVAINHKLYRFLVIPIKRAFVKPKEILQIKLTLKDTNIG